MARCRGAHGDAGEADPGQAHRARGGAAPLPARRAAATAGAGSAAGLAFLGPERKAETVTESNVLQLVSPPRQLPEVIAALRSWDPAGIGAWVLGAQARLPLTAEECRLLAQKIDTLELSSMEFERVIALVGLSLGLDCRRRLTVGKTIYGKDREVDVLFRDARNGNRLAVEAKYQRVTGDRKSTRLNSSHSQISYAVFCLKKKKNNTSDANIVLEADSPSLHTHKYNTDFIHPSPHHISQIRTTTSPNSHKLMLLVMRATH